MRLKEFLESLNFNKYEKEIILYLTSINAANATTIYKNSNIPKGRIYDVLNSLIQKNIVSVSPTSPKQYSVADPKKKLTQYLEHNRSSLQQKINKLSKIDLSKRALNQPNIPSAKYYSGFKEHMNIITELGSKTKKELLQIAPVFAGTNKTHLRLKKLIEKNISIKTITSEVNKKNQKNIHLLLQNNKQVRQLNSSYLFSLIIRDKKEMLLGINNNEKNEERLNVLVSSPQIIQSMLLSFNHLWKQAKPIEVEELKHLN